MVLLQTIAEKEGIKVTEDDLDGHLKDLAAEHHVPLPKLKAHFDEEKLENLARRLRVDKTVDLLLRYAVVAPAPTADAAPATDAIAAPDSPSAEGVPPAADQETNP